MKLVLIKESFRFPPHLLHSLKLNESRLSGPGQVLCPLRTIFHLKPLSDAPAPLSPRIPPYEPSRVLRPGDSKDIYTRLIKKKFPRLISLTAAPARFSRQLRRQVHIL